MHVAGNSFTSVVKAEVVVCLMGTLAQPLLSQRKSGAAQPPQKLTRCGMRARSGRYYMTRTLKLKIILLIKD